MSSLMEIETKYLKEKTCAINDKLWAIKHHPGIRCFIILFYTVGKIKENIKSNY